MDFCIEPQHEPPLQFSPEFVFCVSLCRGRLGELVPCEKSCFTIASGRHSRIHTDVQGKVEEDKDDGEREHKHGITAKKKSSKTKNNRKRSWHYTWMPGASSLYRIIPPVVAAADWGAVDLAGVDATRRLIEQIGVLELEGRRR